MLRGKQFYYDDQVPARPVATVPSAPAPPTMTPNGSGSSSPAGGTPRREGTSAPGRGGA